MFKRQTISATLFASFVAMATMADVVKVGNLNYHYIIEHDGISITNVTGSGETINVPSCVNVDGENIPVVRIKKKSFLGARNTLRSVRSVTIPDSVTDIEPCALYLGSGLTLLTKLVLPYAGNTDQWFKGLFFEYDYGYETDGNLPYTLEEIVITGGTSVPRGSFRNARRRVYDGSWEHPYPDDPCADSEYTDAFKVSLPDSITTIGYEAFRESALASIDLPHGLTNISPYAFYRCQALRNIEIPDSVIGELPSFYNCVSLTNVTIGSGITGCQFNWTYSYSFKQIDYSTQIVTNVVVVTKNLPLLKSVRTTDLSAWCKMSYNNPSNNPLSVAHNLYLNNAQITRLVIPSGVDSIEQYAFYGASKIEKATIPDSVTHIGRDAFVGCKNSLFDTNTIPSLVLVDGWVVEPSWPILEPRGDGGFVECLTRESDLDLNGVRGIADYAFDGYTYLENLTIGSTVKGIGRHALDGSGRLVNLTIDSSVKNFGEYAFANCTSLTNLTVGSSADNIGDYAFVNCTNIERITILGNVTNVGRFAFNDCSNLKRIVVMGSITNASPYAFPHLPHIKVCISKSSHTDFASIFPNTDITVFDPANPNPRVSFDAAGGTVSPGSKIVTRLEKYGTLPVPVRTGYVFEGWFNGKEIVDANTVVDEFAPEHTLIARWSVNPNWHLVTFDANGGEGIDGKTRWCELMEYGSAIIPPTVTRKYCIFAGWSPSVAATVPGEDVTYTAQWHSPWLTIEGTTLKKVDFHGISFSEMLIPDVVTDIGSYAFSGCGSLTSLTIPSNVTNIGNAVFVGCANLSSIDVDANNQYFSSQNRLLLSKDGRTLIQGIGGNVTIPDCVTNINEYAFSGYSDLKSVAIPASVKSIGIYAFDYCENLKEVHIDDVSAWCKIRFEDLYSGAGSGGSGVTPKGNPFHYAKKLYVAGECISELIVPPDVDMIERYTFAGLSNILKVTVLGNAYISEYSFCRCENLAEVIIGEAVYDVRKNAFADCRDLKHVVFEGSYTGVLTNAFPGCNAELYDTTTIPGVVCIGGYAFGLADGAQLDTLDLTGVKGIATSAFVYKDCLTRVRLPEEMACVGTYAFGSCTNIMEITIPHGVKMINRGAFAGCSGLSCVTIPNSVTNIGYGAFGGCSSLWGVVFAGNAPTCAGYCFERVDPDCVAYVHRDSTGWVVDENGKWNGVAIRYVGGQEPTATYHVTFDANGGVGGWSRTMEYGAAIEPPTVTREGYTFVGWSPSVAATVPAEDVTFVAVWESDTGPKFNIDSQKRLLDVEFNGATNIVIPDGVKILEFGVFMGCSNLLSVIIPDSVIRIWSWAFMDCSELTSITIPNGVSKIENSTFSGCSGLQSVVMGAGVTNIAANAFEDCSSLTNLVIPSGVTGIGDYAFENCSGLKNVSIPDGVDKIARRTFYRCSGLQSVVIGNGVTNIEPLAFSGCSSLTNMVLPDGVVRIGAYAFSGCSGLNSVRIPDSVASIGEDAFSGCRGLTSVTIPDSVTSIGDNAFNSCTGLVSVTIGSGVTNIGDRAFSWCNSLRSIIFNGDAPDIGSNIFNGVNDFCVVYINRGSSGWEVDEDGKWNGLLLRYIDETKVTFDASGGNGGWSQTMEYGAAIVPPTVTRVGYTFAGWSPSVSATVPAEDVTYIARWIANRYTVKFDANGGNGVMDDVTCIYDGEALSLTNCFTRLGYSVVGWSSVDGDMVFLVGQEAVNLVSQNDGEITLYAIWTPNQYSVSFDANGGIGGWSRTMRYGAAIEPPTVTREGYTFAGWSPAVAATVPAGDVTYTAQWTPMGYTVRFDANGGIGGWSQTMESGSAIVPPAVTRVGYTFAGWSPSVAATVPAEDVTYIARWTANRYTVKFDANGGEGVMDNVSGVYDGEALSLTNCFTRLGYSVVGWATSADGDVVYPVGQSVENLVSQNGGEITLYAIWTPSQYSVSFDANGGMGGWTRMMEYGATIAPPTVTRVGYTFIGWSPSVEATVPAEDVICTAQWAVNSYTVTFDANGGEGGWSRNMEYGALIEPPTVTRDGYEFLGWSPSPPLSVPAANVTYTARWKDLDARPHFTIIPIETEIYTDEGWCYTNLNTLTAVDLNGNTEITIPEGVDCIGSYVFSGCKSLRSVKLPYGVIQIWNRAFDGCNNLASVTLPETIKKIGDQAFSWCEGLRCLTIPSSVTEIGWHAFTGCRDLKIIFNGDAPDMDGDGIGVGGCTAYVKQSASGWYDNGDFKRMVHMSEAIQTLSIYDDAAWRVTNKIESTGFVDEDAIISVINGNADEYRKFKAWAQGTDDGEAAVIMSTRAAKSYLFGAKALLDKEVTSDDVTIESFSPTSTDGKFDFTVSVKDVNIGSGSVETESLKENLKKVLGVEGAATLTPGAFSSDNIDITFGAPVNGKAKITVSPPADAGNSFFMRVKVK